VDMETVKWLTMLAIDLGLHMMTFLIPDFSTYNVTDGLHHRVSMNAIRTVEYAVTYFLSSSF
jgi:hypothetical protein